MLPEGVYLISEEDRDQDGMYMLNSGCTHVFPFRVALMGKTSLMFNHTMIGTQDHSVKAWFSRSPLDNTVFPDNVGFFGIDRAEQVYEISDDLSVDPGILVYPSSEILYINVKNMQNSMNGYTLTFTDEPGLQIG